MSWGTVENSVAGEEGHACVVFSSVAQWCLTLCYPMDWSTQASLVVQETVDHISHYPGRYSLLDTTPADF